jgi:membrane protein YqaA with SNARE-associated domain
MYEYLIVGALSSFEIYAAIATGLAFGHTSLELCITTLLGGIAGVLVSIFLGDKITLLISKYRKPKPVEKLSKSKLILNNLWAKYGQFGVGFIGTLVVGAPVSIGVAVGFGAQIKTLIWYCIAGVLVRCVVFSYFFGFVKDFFM